MDDTDTKPADDVQQPATDGPREDGSADPPRAERKREIGGPAGPEPTRYGDWERNGRCTDF